MRLDGFARTIKDLSNDTRIWKSKHGKIFKNSDLSFWIFKLHSLSIWTPFFNHSIAFVRSRKDLSNDAIIMKIEGLVGIQKCFREMAFCSKIAMQQFCKNYEKRRFFNIIFIPSHALIFKILVSLERSFLFWHTRWSLWGPTRASVTKVTCADKG
jgi:hypothetical protein